MRYQAALVVLVIGSLLVPKLMAAPRLVSFSTQDGGLIYANDYGTGERAVVLAHGARFNKESWAKQAAALEQVGFHVLALGFRGYGRSHGGPASKPGFDDMYLDVLGAIQYLVATGARTVSLLGASMGGKAVAEAAVHAAFGAIDRIVLLANVPINNPEKMAGRKLFIVSSGDALAGKVKDQFERASEPKQLITLDGSAHAQAIFATEKGEQLMNDIIGFLSGP